MSVPTFESLAPSYARMWADLVPTPSHLAELQRICTLLKVHKPTYQNVAEQVWHNVNYWFIVALLDQMEGGGGCNTYLGNGQSLKRATTEVPAGRGPFASFFDGCIDALHLDGFDKITTWPIERIAYQFEAWNGWGYLNKPITDPYLTSFSNLYTKGKWVSDHHYDPEAVSQQPGALTILKVLADMDPSIKLTSVFTPAAPASAPPAQEKALSTTAIVPANANGSATAVAPVIDYNALAAAIVSAQAAAAQATPQVDLASMLTHLQVFTPLVAAVMSAIPEAAPYAPLVGVGQKVVTAVDEIATTLQTNAQALPAVLASHFADIGPLLKQVAGVFPAWTQTLMPIAMAMTNAATAINAVSAVGASAPTPITAASP